MIVVSDTTPLISLLKIQRIDILERLFGEIIIPRAVYNELTIDSKFASEAKIVNESNFIHIMDVKNAISVDILKRATGLDQGESEAIILSDEMKADILLMDEAKGRAVSNQMGLHIMGTIGVLMAAYEECILTTEDVKQCVEQLQKAGRHISQRHYQMLLDRLK